MFSKFFIERPVFATVLSIVIVIIGGVSALSLPVAQYPEVTPPTISVTANYAGANAQTVADTVASPIEQQINGVENMLYMSSQCTNDGQMNLTVTFALGTNLDMAQVLVQNRVAIALSGLPAEVRQTGVVTKKRSSSILLAVNLTSKTIKDPLTGEDRPKYEQLFLSNYAALYLQNSLARIKGVGDVTFLGPRDYSMRIWLDPNKLASRNMSANDVANAVREQNVQVAAGRIGQPPSPSNIYFQTPINTLGRLTTEDQFANIVIKVGEQQQVTYLRDVVRDRFSDVNLDRGKLDRLKLTPKDVEEAFRARQTQIKSVSAGGLKLTINTQSQKPETVVLTIPRTGQTVEARDLTLSDEGIVDVQKGIELGAKNYDVSTYLDFKPTVMMAVFQLPGANAIQTANAVRKEMKDLEKDFPKGVEYKIVYDTTIFIKDSIWDVVKTLIEAFILVFIVVLVFLQDWRATILPMIEVPVSLIGTIGVMALLGFSFNNLSLFGMVLAIGIVVDDAIVVIENVETWMAKGYDAKTATIKAMQEVTGPILAIALVLAAVFIPTAFMAGISGRFYRQFALTIAASTLISALNALTMTPARCALILKAPAKEGDHSHKEAFPNWGVGLLLGAILTVYAGSPLIELLGFAPATVEGESADTPWQAWAIRGGLFLIGCVVGWLLSKPVNRIIAIPLRGFNKVFDRVTAGYGRAVRLAVRLSVVMLLIYAGLIALTLLGFRAAPTGFIPQQDKGYLIANAQLPEGANVGRTETVMRQMRDIALDTEGVDHALTLVGYSVLNSANLSNMGAMFVILKPFEERKNSPDLQGDRILNRLRERFAKEIKGEEARTVVFGAPPVEGLGNTGGFKMQVEDKGNRGAYALQGAVENVAAKGNAQQGRLVGLFSSFSANQPQLFIDIDRVKAKAAQVSLQDVFSTLQIYVGSFYVNDITLYSRNWQVIIQADEKYRQKPEDIGRLEVRNAGGRMVPLGTVISVRNVTGPAIVNRYNTYPSAEINGNTAPGFSSGQAIDLMAEIAREDLPGGMKFEWTELSFQQIEADQDVGTKLVFPLSILFVYMVLAALYEDWTLPLAILLIVPMCMLCAIGGVLLNGMDNNIFTQIGLVVLVGLASKNAILMVEFAKERETKGGLSPSQAAIEAARLRLRPILMTAFAFILGVVPLMLARGAGAEMRVALGVAVFYGMLGVTLFGLFFTPVFYFVIRWITGHRTATPPVGDSSSPG